MTMKHFNLYKITFSIEVTDTCTAYFGAGEGIRTPNSSRTVDFKSTAYTSSATPASIKLAPHLGVEPRNME